MAKPRIVEVKTDAGLLKFKIPMWFIKGKNAPRDRGKHSKRKGKRFSKGERT